MIPTPDVELGKVPSKADIKRAVDAVVPHRLVSSELLPRVKAGEHIRLRDLAEELFDQFSDILTAEARGCPDDGVLFDYLNGQRHDPTEHPDIRISHE